MTGGQIAIVVGAFVISDLFVVSLIISKLLSSSWGILQERFPRRADGPGAVRKEFQTLRINSSNFGGCLHLTVDSECLHADPAKFLRIMKLKPFSVPWEEMEWRGRSTSFGQRGLIRVRIAGMDVAGPEWALSMAAPAEAPTGEHSHRS